MKQLLIFGTGESALRVAFDAERWKQFDVVAFVDVERPSTWPADRAFCELSTIRTTFSPADTWAFAAGTERHLNQDRLAAFMRAKSSGFKVTSVVSPNASVANDVRIRENSYIGDHCSVLPGSNLGANLWFERGCHVGLTAKVGSSCWLDSGCTIGDRATLGKNCTLYRHVAVAPETSLPAWSLIAEFSTVDISHPNAVFRDPLFRSDVILRGSGGSTGPSRNSDA